jgi:hypothetical protein
MLEQIVGERYAEKKSGGQGRDELQPKAKSVARADDGWQPGVNRSIELNFEQIAGIQEDARVQNHPAFTQLDSTPWHNSG